MASASLRASATDNVNDEVPCAVPCLLALSSCVVKLHRRGPYLVASDNNNCGGLNVSFNGIYTKAKTDF